MSQGLTCAGDLTGESGIFLDQIGSFLAEKVADGKRISTQRLNEYQPEAFALARHLSQNTACRSLIEWASSLGELEHQVTELYCAMAGAEISHWMQYTYASLGFENQAPAFSETVREFITSRMSTQWMTRLGRRIMERQKDPAGQLGLGEMHQMVREEFARFSDEKVQPLAEEIHRHDQLIPESLLTAMGALGVFGISIPDQYGGAFIDHGTMIIATEELSRASLGAGGSVITRPEICAKAILKGGTKEQKAHWLPKIASGEKIICVAVTEPDAGSDVASVKLAARQSGDGWLLNGEKTWCTFAGRADVLCVLARTGAIDEGHKGLTLFLAEKPGRRQGEGDEYSFKHTQDGGGVVEGNAIPTIGYRGMHSFSVSFQDYYVPDSNRIGELGQGFYLQMEGFSGGRIQTAARALGVMEAAFRNAISYVQDRQVFGQSLGEFGLTQVKLAQMAARIQAGRQLAYHVGTLMDRGQGGLEASLVKFMTCKDAEWVTREAMQLHGGMGYSEEYPVSRYWQDARVLSIFEGAEEVLALLVIARQYLARFIL